MYILVGRKSALVITLGAMKQRKPELCSRIHRKADRNSGWGTSVKMRCTQKSSLLSQILLKSLKNRNKNRKRKKENQVLEILQEKFWQLLCYMWSWCRIVYKAFWFKKKKKILSFSFTHTGQVTRCSRSLLAPHLLNSWDNSALFNCSAIWKWITVRRSGFFLPSLSALLGKGVPRSDI